MHCLHARPHDHLTLICCCQCPYARVLEVWLREPMSDCPGRLEGRGEVASPVSAARCEASEEGL